jgi:hypothetical protein
MEKWPIEIDDFPIKTSIYKGFSMAMLNNQMVTSSIDSGPPQMMLGVAGFAPANSLAV